MGGWGGKEGERGGGTERWREKGTEEGWRDRRMERERDGGTEEQDGETD